MAYEVPDDYVDVAERIREFREKHPDGSLQQVDLQFVTFAGKDWVVFTAAAYRSPEDPRPGQGTAWEPVPGRTPFTRDSELQNAETAAWGRAIVAALAADTKRIATAQDVRNRQADATAPPPQESPGDMVRRGIAEAKDLPALDRVLAWAEAQSVDVPTQVVEAKRTELGAIA